MQATYPYKVTASLIHNTPSDILDTTASDLPGYNEQNRKCDYTELDQPDGTFHLTDRRDWTDFIRQTHIR